jgi:hypothetical protein
MPSLLVKANQSVAVQSIQGTHPAKTALRDLRQIAEHCRYGQPYAQCLWAA